MTKRRKKPWRTRICRWTEQRSGNWLTDCNGIWIGRIHSGALYCLFCGKPVVEVPIRKEPANE